MKYLFFLALSFLSTYSMAQSDNSFPLRASYKLILIVDKGAVYEMDIASTPYVQKQAFVQVYPGETIYLEAEENNGKLLLSSVKEIKDSAKTIIISCVQNAKKGKHENVMLKVINPFNKDLTYSARMLPLNANKWVSTDVLPVGAKLMGIEMWPDVIISFGLGDWHLSSK